MIKDLNFSEPYEDQDKIVELVLTEEGELIIGRSQHVKLNEATLEMLELSGINTFGLREFFDSQNEIEHILGDEPLCG